MTRVLRGVVRTYFQPAAPRTVDPDDEWYSPEGLRFRAGTGDWEAVILAGIPLPTILDEAKQWKADLAGVEKPWLCWNVDPDWSLVQQRLVREVGWTPVVGFDPRVGPPPLIRGAVLIDFNRTLRLPTMWMHFPLELLFLFVEQRLAYWHADCLVRLPKLHAYAEMFEQLRDGEMAAVTPRSRRMMRYFPHMHRLWEVLACSTVGASRSQFELGSGWWMNTRFHPSASEEERRRMRPLHYECGVGVHYWMRHHHGVVKRIPEQEIAEGHFTLIGRKDYKRASPTNFKRDLSKELSLNTDLVQACATLELGPLLADIDPPAAA